MESQLTTEQQQLSYRRTFRVRSDFQQCFSSGLFENLISKVIWPLIVGFTGACTVLMLCLMPLHKFIFHMTYTALVAALVVKAMYEKNLSSRAVVWSQNIVASPSEHIFYFDNFPSTRSSVSRSFTRPSRTQVSQFSQESSSRFSQGGGFQVEKQFTEEFRKSHNVISKSEQGSRGSKSQSNSRVSFPKDNERGPEQRSEAKSTTSIESSKQESRSKKLLEILEENEEEDLYKKSESEETDSPEQTGDEEEQEK